MLERRVGKKSWKNVGEKCWRKVFEKSVGTTF